MRWAGHVARMGEDRGVHRMLVGKPEGKRPLGRPRRRWENNIKMDLQEVGGGRGDTPYSQAPSACDPPSMSATRFHTHTKPRAKL
jgi:hypothetical protein